MEWSDFKVVLALHRAGSVAGAARELQVDSSTISRRLSALEEAASAKLLIRGGREFSWTSEGKLVIEAAEAMEAATACALRAIRASKVDVEGSVRVSVAPAFVLPLMQSMMPALRRAHPMLHVQLEGGFLRKDLAKGDADLALRMSRPEEPDLIGRRAFDCGWFVYASRSYLESHPRPARFEDLSQHALVLYGDLRVHAPPMRWIESYAQAAKAISRMDSVETACIAAQAGGGIAVLPAFTGDPTPDLVRVFPDRVSVNTGWVVYHQSLRDTFRVKVVADALIDFFREHESTFTGLPASVSPDEQNARDTTR
jgi:DNA-binding transcriptional LysR family regulator